MLDHTANAGCLDIPCEVFRWPIDRFRMQPQDANIPLLPCFKNSDASINFSAPQSQSITHTDFFPLFDPW
jgi:hypothetical protein